MTIAVYGATGYTGKLVAAELRRRDIDMVLVGRDAERLRQARAEIGSPSSAVRTADLDDPDGLAATFRGCPVVINCVAPFTLWGEPVVRAAIAAGSHYVDISGEQRYLKRIFDTFADQAEQAGVTVVPMVNDGGFLADLLAGLTAARVRKAEDVVVAHRSVGSPGLSRGSGRSALANSEIFANGGLSYEDGEWRTGIPAKCTSVTFPGSPGPSPVTKFAMPEVVTIPRHVDARHVEGVTDAELAARFTAITPELVESLPEGPAGDQRRTGRFILVADVTGEAGHARGIIEGSDTYGTTAVIVVEAARRLAVDGAKPGVLAPAQAFDATAFLDSLAPHGVRWSVETH
jgi:short subunit dehydrogenase-like uncharacterized protein